MDNNDALCDDFTFDKYIELINLLSNSDELDNIDDEFYKTTPFTKFKKVECVERYSSAIGMHTKLSKIMKNNTVENRIESTSGPIILWFTDYLIPYQGDQDADDITFAITTRCSSLMESNRETIRGQIDSALLLGEYEKFCSSFTRSISNTLSHIFSSGDTLRTTNADHINIFDWAIVLHSTFYSSGLFETVYKSSKIMDLCVTNNELFLHLMNRKIGDRNKYSIMTKILEDDAKLAVIIDTHGIIEVWKMISLDLFYTMIHYRTILLLIPDITDDKYEEVENYIADMRDADGFNFAHYFFLGNENGSMLKTISQQQTDCEKIIDKLYPIIMRLKYEKCENIYPYMCGCINEFVDYKDLCNRNILFYEDFFKSDDNNIPIIYYSGSIGQIIKCGDLKQFTGSDDEIKLTLSSLFGELSLEGTMETDSNVQSVIFQILSLELTEKQLLMPINMATTTNVYPLIAILIATIGSTIEFGKFLIKNTNVSHPTYIAIINILKKYPWLIPFRLTISPTRTIFLNEFDCWKFPFGLAHALSENSSLEYINMYIETLINNISTIFIIDFAKTSLARMTQLLFFSLIKNRDDKIDPSCALALLSALGTEYHDEVINMIKLYTNTYGDVLKIIIKMFSRCIDGDSTHIADSDQHIVDNIFVMIKKLYVHNKIDFSKYVLSEGNIFKIFMENELNDILVEMINNKYGQIDIKIIMGEPLNFEEILTTFSTEEGKNVFGSLIDNGHFDNFYDENKIIINTLFEVCCDECANIIMKLPNFNNITIYDIFVKAYNTSNTNLARRMVNSCDIDETFKTNFSHEFLNSDYSSVSKDMLELCFEKQLIIPSIYDNYNEIMTTIMNRNLVLFKSIMNTVDTSNVDTFFNIDKTNLDNKFVREMVINNNPSIYEKFISGDANNKFKTFLKIHSDTILKDILLNMNTECFQGINNCDDYIPSLDTIIEINNIEDKCSIIKSFIKNDILTIEQLSIMSDDICLKDILNSNHVYTGVFNELIKKFGVLQFDDDFLIRMLGIDENVIILIENITSCESISLKLMDFVVARLNREEFEGNWITIFRFFVNIGKVSLVPNKTVFSAVNNHCTAIQYVKECLNAKCEIKYIDYILITFPDLSLLLNDFNEQIKYSIRPPNYQCILKSKLINSASQDIILENVLNHTQYRYSEINYINTDPDVFVKHVLNVNLDKEYTEQQILKDINDLAEKTLTECLQCVTISSKFIEKNHDLISELICNDIDIFRNFMKNEICVDKYMYTLNKNKNYNLTLIPINDINEHVASKFIKSLSFEDLTKTIRGVPQIYSFLKNPYVKPLFERKDMVKLFEIHQLGSRVITLLVKNTIAHINSLQDDTTFSRILSAVPEEIRHCTDKYGNTFFHMLVKYHNGDSKYTLDDVIKLILSYDKPTVCKILNHRTTSGNTLLFHSTINEQIIPTMLNLYSTELGKESLEVSNDNGETFLMYLLKHNKHIDIESILNNELITDQQNYIDINSGSVMSHAIMYCKNIDTFNALLQWKNLSKNWLDITQTVELYDYLSGDDPLTSKIKINLSIPEIACIFRPDIFKIIIDSPVFNTKSLDELVTINNESYTLIQLAFIYEPESFHYLLGFKYVEDLYGENNDKKDELANFCMDYASIQPASWYIFVNSSVYDSTMYTQDTLYGMHYDLRPQYIGEISGFIQTKNEHYTSEENKCNLCGINKIKIMFGCNKHTACVCCAYKTEVCPSCRGNKLNRIKIFD